MAEAPPGELALAVGGRRGVESGPARGGCGSRGQQGLEAARVFDRSLDAGAGARPFAERPEHAQGLDGQDRREVGAAGGAARTTGRVDGRRVQQVPRVAIEGRVGAVEQRPQGGGDLAQGRTVLGERIALGGGGLGDRTGLGDGSLDVVLSVAQRSEDRLEQGPRFIAVPGAVKSSSPLRGRAAIVFGDDTEADHARA